MSTLLKLKCFMTTVSMAIFFCATLYANDPSKKQAEPPQPKRKSAVLLLKKEIKKTGNLKSGIKKPFPFNGIGMNPAGSVTPEDNFAEEYFQILTYKLTDTQVALDYLRDRESLIPEEDRFAVYNGEMKDVDHIEKAIFITSVWNAGADIYRKTELSRKVRGFERKVVKYFVMEYSKSLTDKNPGFYMPGQLSHEKMNEKKEYRITLSSFLFPNENTLKMDLSSRLNILMFQTNISSSYSFTDEETKISLSNLMFNSLTGSQSGASVILNNDTPPVYIMTAAIRF